MIDLPRPIELLAPAKNLSTAIAAIDHGADAVYIGPPSFGARASAGNSLEDIKRLTDYAHQFRVKVYATVNTIIYDKELRQVEKLIHELYRARVDAIIVQDMGILRFDIPPIELHASTQCDTRTVEKAIFLEKVGFSQIVLARELTLEEIKEICDSVTVPVETFVHGALCVSYSGRCHAGQALMGRSANRGECPQICRMKFDLVDSEGFTLTKDRHLLSLKDFNASNSLPSMLEAGVSSFKIEGRLKDISYVKNVTAWYRGLLDGIITANPGKYVRSSVGNSKFNFESDPYKSFNRGFTSYFLKARRPNEKMASILTPKSLGEPLDAGQLPNNGDGISFFNPVDNSYQGVRVNKVVNGKIIPATPIRIPKGIKLYRTFNNQWEKLMSGDKTSSRSISVDIELYDNRVRAVDERGCSVILYYNAEIQTAKSDKFNLRRIFEKTGGTVYRLRDFKSFLPENSFIPPSLLTDLRRRLLEALDAENSSTYKFTYRRKEDRTALFPTPILDYRDNVSNHLAKEFYLSHGVKEIEMAMEVSQRKRDKCVMTCRYCILRQLGKCLKSNSEKINKPLYLRLSDGRKLHLDFDCKRCEMKVYL